MNHARRLSLLFVSAWTLVAVPCGAQQPASGELKTVPDWAAEAVWYQIFPARFRNGDPGNDPTLDTLEFPVRPSPAWTIRSWTADWYARAPWEKELGDDFYEDGVRDRRYGGDIQGVIDKLDYLQETGVTALYFNPVFESRSLHKYDANTYHHIAPHFGPDPAGDRALMEQETSDPSTWQWTAADRLFLQMLKQAHTRGIRVIIDGAFNHTGRDFFAFRNLRREQQKSPYKDWYVVQEFDDPETKRNEFRYNGWWGNVTLPEFAETKDGKDLHPGPKAYIMDATRRWMDPNGDGDPSDGIDGWRLDTADEVPIGFWRDWNSFVRKINPDAYTVCGVWHSPAELVVEGRFSAAMNYHGFAIPVKGFFIDGALTAAQLGEMLDRRRQELPEKVAYVMQNLMDSHDTDRLASMIMNPAPPGDEAGHIPYDTSNSPRTSETYDIRKPGGRARSIQRMIVLMQMTYAGAPMIYYGSEAGMWGADDPDDRMPMVWQDLKFEPQAIDPRGWVRQPDDVNFDPVVYAFYKQVIALRRDYKALNRGAFTVVKTADRAFAFTRHTADQHLLAVFNRSEEAATIPLALGEDSARYAEPVMIFTTADRPDAVTLEPGANGLNVKMPPLTGVVIGGK